jgi:hypothetical protein
MSMLEIMNEHYFIDMDEIDKYVLINVDSSSAITYEHHINIVRYETIKLMLEVLMDGGEEIDESLGSKSAKHLSIPFRLSFNTLLNKKIIKSY